MNTIIDLILFLFQPSVKDIDKLNPEITQTYETVKVRQDDLEHRRKEADEKLRKLKELIEQVSKSI